MSQTLTIRTAPTRWPGLARCVRAASLLLALTSAVGLLGCGARQPESPVGEREEQPAAWHADGRTHAASTPWSDRSRSATRSTPT